MNIVTPQQAEIDRRSKVAIGAAKSAFPAGFMAIGNPDAPYFTVSAWGDSHKTLVSLLTQNPAVLNLVTRAVLEATVITTNAGTPPDSPPHDGGS